MSEARALELEALTGLGPPPAPQAYGCGSAGRLEEGLWVVAWVKMANEHIVDVTFEVFGSPEALCIADWVARRVGGSDVEDAARVRAVDAVESLGLPPGARGEALYIEDALARAIAREPSGGSDEH